MSKLNEPEQKVVGKSINGQINFRELELICQSKAKARK